MTNDIENKMVLPAADPESEPEVVEEDEDTAYERARQEEIDDLNSTLESITRSLSRSPMAKRQA